MKPDRSQLKAVGVCVNCHNQAFCFATHDGDCKCDGCGRADCNKCTHWSTFNKRIGAEPRLPLP